MWSDNSRAKKTLSGLRRFHEQAGAGRSGTWLVRGNVEHAHILHL